MYTQSVCFTLKLNEDLFMSTLNLIKFAHYTGHEQNSREETTSPRSNHQICGNCVFTRVVNTIVTI